MDMVINGRTVEFLVDARTSLLDLLRDHLGLTGSKKGCNQGACGACTVLVDGERINSCLALAMQYQGRVITTVEGLTPDHDLHPLQGAFVEHDGFQCGYCTPGQICSAVGMASELREGVPSYVTADLEAENVRLGTDLVTSVRRRRFPVEELLLQTWYAIRVCTLPALMVSTSPLQ